MRMKSMVKKIGRILFYTFFVSVLVLVVGMMISKFSNRVFFFGNHSAIWVMTDSMEEQIPAQTYILIRRVEDPSQINTNDIITFYSDDPALRGHLNTHRVLRTEDGGKTFITKGDHNLAEDFYPARAEAVVGVYEKNLPALTAMGRLLQSRVGFGVILCLIAALTVYSFAGDFVKQWLKKKKEAEPSNPPQ